MKSKKWKKKLQKAMDYKENMLKDKLTMELFLNGYKLKWIQKGFNRYKVKNI